MCWAEGDLDPTSLNQAEKLQLPNRLRLRKASE